MLSTPILRYVGYSFEEIDAFQFPRLREIVAQHTARQVVRFTFGYLLADAEGNLYFEAANEFPTPYYSGIYSFIDYCHLRADLGGPNAVDAAYQRQEKLISAEETNPRWERADDATPYFGAVE